MGRSCLWLLPKQHVECLIKYELSDYRFRTNPEGQADEPQVAVTDVMALPFAPSVWRRMDCDKDS